MYTVTKEIYFCYGHRLLQYDGPCRHLHGHNGKVEVELERDSLDGRGMVVDFADIRNVIKDWIDRTLDHTMLLAKDDPFIPIFKEKNERFYVMNVNPTAEAIAKLIFDYAHSRNLPVTRVTLWETESSFASYTGEQ
ncbi:MAG: 6-pyruvoyl tetrahydrobiopterin synthase [Omnitrophica bacterium RIFCSPLOWO2_01_FULL_50_24]|nr:MAG: 6-pyruvoyl tetrahydrobiopterin synthase [Omnitrophica bacterium RIFCSPLOWO2_01_FULL_50_24]